MRLSDEAQANMKEIQALENKYGLMVFRMGLVHLFDSGHGNFSDELVEGGLRLIATEEEAGKAEGRREFISPDFKRSILSCSAELSKFSIVTLFAYIKEYFVVDI